MHSILSNSLEKSAVWIIKIKSDRMHRRALILFYEIADSLLANRMDRDGASEDATLIASALRRISR
jgi:hypothetical protein